MVGIKEFLKKREEGGLLRVLRPVSLRKEGKIVFGTRTYFDFSSNDYLGLSGHPLLKSAAKKAIDEFGTSSCASRLMSGSLVLHHRLEEKIARFKNKEAALVFNSGYQANIGIISSLFGRQDAVFCDRLAHASIVDAIILSQAKLFRFQHNDPGHLKEMLLRQRSKFKNALIVTESVFSMDADRAPLKELVGLKEKYACWLMVDEAHATGVFGKDGAGLAQEEGVEDKVDLLMGTFSKALAGFGAYLAASREIADYLINACRSFIYSTALPPAAVAVNLASIDLVKSRTQERRALLENARSFRQALQKKGLEVKGSSQIVPLIIGDAAKSKDLASALQDKGFWVMPVRPPTVPQQEARLRFSLTSHHNKEILQKLTDEILRCGI